MAPGSRPEPEDLCVAWDGTALHRGYQAVLHDHVDHQRLVALGVEEDDDLVAFVAHDDAGAELLVRYLRVDGEGASVFRVLLPLLEVLLRQARLAIIAVAAEVVALLAEVIEQEMPPALGRFGVAFNDLDAA